MRKDKAEPSTIRETLLIDDGKIYIAMMRTRPEKGEEPGPWIPTHRWGIYREPSFLLTCCRNRNAMTEGSREFRVFAAPAECFAQVEDDRKPVKVEIEKGVDNESDGS